MFSPCVQEMRLLQAYEDSGPLRSALTPSYSSCWWSGWRTYLGIKSAEDLSAAAAVKLGWTEALLLFLQIKSRRGDGEWPGIWPGMGFWATPCWYLEEEKKGLENWIPTVESGWIHYVGFLLWFGDDRYVKYKNTVWSEPDARHLVTAAQV